MSVPNILSISRILLAPVFLGLFMLRDRFSHPAFVVLLAVLYVYLEISDVLDGWIARRYNLVTDLGRVLDPFADVVSRLTFFLCFVQAGVFPVFLFALILYRELGITFLRSLMFRQGISVAANIWGKSKALLYTVASIVGFMVVFGRQLGIRWAELDLAGVLLLSVFVLAVVASWLSFTTYLRAFLKSIKPQ